MNKRPYQLVLWGASGFTGRLVTKHLCEAAGEDREFRWALAGRDTDKLHKLRMDLGPDAAELPIVIADSLDAASMADLARSADVVCSTVGPYARYGSHLVAACAAEGTHYCDITGEPQWIRRMIDECEDVARNSGARLVHCCGFDSIPSDLGCLLMNRAMAAAEGGPCEEIKFRVRAMRGGISGGTIASVLNLIEQARDDRALRRLLADPYALNPDGEHLGPDGPDQRKAEWDGDFDSWTAPFLMAPVNTRIVRRSNALLDYAYGRSFKYSEAMLTGSGLRGRTTGVLMAGAFNGFVGAMALAPTRALLKALVLPKPGEGPSRERRNNGFFDIRLYGRRGKTELRGAVTADSDPGYGATSRMLAESALCLALDGEQLPVGGGSWTPATALGTRLRHRLENAEIMTFQIP